MEDLFEYQKTGAKWLTESRFRLLADEMGLGKSAQAVTGCDLVGAKEVLVIGPSISKYNWLREFNTWSETPFGFQIMSRFSDTPEAGKSVICSYDYASSQSQKLIRSWDVAIMDEAHFLKSLDAKRAKNIMGKGGIAHSSKRVWQLSGTPAPNHAGELWISLYTFGITPMKYSEFVSIYCETEITPRGVRILGTKREKIPELKALLANIMLRRKKEDVMKDLPPIVFQDHTVEPGEVDLPIESSFIQYTFPFDRRKELSETLDKQTKLLEGLFTFHMTGSERVKAMEGMANSVSTLRRYTGIQKVQPVADLISEELENNAYDKVVLFAVHRDVIEGLRRRLTKFGAVSLYGGTAPDKRDKHIQKFQNSPKTRVCICNIQSAGTNITLTAAHQVVFVEQDWVPGNNAQAAMRCHRIGQTKPVTVRFFSIENSVDSRIANVLRRKTKELTEIFND